MNIKNRFLMTTPTPHPSSMIYIYRHSTFSNNSMTTSIDISFSNIIDIQSIYILIFSPFSSISFIIWHLTSSMNSESWFRVYSSSIWVIYPRNQSSEETIMSSAFVRFLLWRNASRSRSIDNSTWSLSTWRVILS